MKHKKIDENILSKKEKRFYFEKKKRDTLYEYFLLNDYFKFYIF
jgi:hypothetical protein